jgi:hypothetical protein
VSCKLYVVTVRKGQPMHQQLEDRQSLWTSGLLWGGKALHTKNLIETSWTLKTLMDLSTISVQRASRKEPLCIGLQSLSRMRLKLEHVANSSRAIPECHPLLAWQSNLPVFLQGLISFQLDHIYFASLFSSYHTSK